jgi:uncharacterized membrane protein YeiH
MVLMLLAAAHDLNLAQNTPLWLSVAATAVGALEGALLMAREPDCDIVGMGVIAACLGFGGGIVRDTMCGTLPPEALRSAWYPGTVILCTVAVWVLARYLRHITGALQILDALVLGLFAVIGAQKALDVGLEPLPAIALGTAVSCAGGVIADLFMNRRPAVIRPGPPYALASLIGVIWYVVAYHYLGVNGGVASAVAIVIIVVVRLGTELFGVQTTARRRGLTRER